MSNVKKELKNWSKADKKKLGDDNYHKFSEQIKNPNRDKAVSDSDLRKTEGGKGDADRSNRKKFSDNYSTINWGK